MVLVSLQPPSLSRSPLFSIDISLLTWVLLIVFLVASKASMSQGFETSYGPSSEADELRGIFEPRKNLLVVGLQEFLDLLLRELHGLELLLFLMLQMRENLLEQKTQQAKATEKTRGRAEEDCLLHSF